MYESDARSKEVLDKYENKNTLMEKTETVAVSRAPPN